LEKPNFHTWILFFWCGAYKTLNLAYLAQLMHLAHLFIAFSTFIAVGLTIHSTPKIKMKYISKKNETRKKVPKYYPFPTYFKV